MLYDRSVPLGHQGVVSFLRSTKYIPSKYRTGIRYKVWDIIYKDKPLDTLSYRERLLLLDDIHHNTKHIHRVKNKNTNKSGVPRAIISVRSREGAVIRALDSKYFDENLLFKIKKTYQVDCKVMKVERAKNGSYIYTCVDSDSDILGKTYGQKLVKAKPGDILTVNITELNRKKENGKWKYTWYSPMVAVAKKNHKFNTDRKVDTKKVLEEIYLAMRKKRNKT